MAVYTDVAAENLALFLADYDIGGLLAYKEIAEGVENSNFLLHTGRGYFILTLYERRVAERDLPFLPGVDGASREPRHHLSTTGEDPCWANAWPACRPAGGNRHFPRRHVDAPAERLARCSFGRSSGAAASRRRRFRHASRQRALGRRLAGALRGMPGTRKYSTARFAGSARSRTRSATSAIGREACRRA